MNQPDLGLKVSELRQQKGWTQALLAERCEVNLRTIQRIEGGEVDPRSYTLQCLSTALEFDFGGENANEAIWLTLMHLSSIFCIFIIPLILWSWKKSQSTKIDRQARQVLNFQITMILGWIVVLIALMVVPIVLAFMGATEGEPVFMLFVMCSTMPLLLMGIFCTYQGIVNAIRALANKPISYALSLPIVK